MALAFSTSISGLRSPSARVAFRPVRSQQKARVAMTPRAAVQEVAEVAASGITAFFGVTFLALGASVASGKQIENRVDEETKKAEGYGIDLTDLFYDIDVPGDQYPFGDAEVRENMELDRAREEHKSRCSAAVVAQYSLQCCAAAE